MGKKVVIWFRFAVSLTNFVQVEWLMFAVVGLALTVHSDDDTSAQGFRDIGVLRQALVVRVKLVTRGVTHMDLGS